MTDDDMHYLLRFILIKAHRRWDYDNRPCDLDEYYDAGREALVRCLERFVPKETCTFRSFAQVAIQWDIHMVWRRYRHWKWGPHDFSPKGRLPTSRERSDTDIWIDAAKKLAHLPAIAHTYKDFVLEGKSDGEYAEAEHITKQSVYSRLRTWRAWS